MDEFLKKLERQKSQFKHDSKIKECFHYDKKNCFGKIKSAHSLQKNGVLDILEYEINKNKVVYSFLHPKPIGEGFIPLGKKECSTFFGFCDYHDSTLFAPIENFEIDLRSDEHCFLLCYRTFSKEYHSKIEANKGYKTNYLYNLPENQIFKNQMIDGNELGLRDLKIIKDKLNDILAKEKYDNLEYFKYILPYTIPIACSASITPSFSYSGKLLNKSDDINDIYENIMITVIPSNKETNIVFGYFLEDEKSSLYIEELKLLPKKELENAITSILIGDIENTFISPIIWERMSKDEQSFLMQELIFTSPFILPIFEDSFFKSSLNLFDPKFSL